MWTTKEVTKMACEQSEVVNKGMKIVKKKKSNRNSGTEKCNN